MCLVKEILNSICITGTITPDSIIRLHFIDPNIQDELSAMQSCITVLHYIPYKLYIPHICRFVLVCDTHKSLCNYILYIEGVD